MSHHPAEFARKGLFLIKEANDRFFESRKNPEKLQQLITEYDKRVENLVNSRVEWTVRDYIIKNVEAAIIGGSVAVIISLAIIIFLERSEIINLPLFVSFKLFLTISVVSGIICGYWKGPRWLSKQEKKNEILLEFCRSANYLYYYYRKLKRNYITRFGVASASEPEVEKKTTDASGEQSIPATIDTEVREGKKRSWGLSEEEREHRRNIFSLRFLLKIAHLKENTDEDKKELPVILVIDADSAIRELFSEYLSEDFNLLTIDKLTEEDFEAIAYQRPELIITEIDFPEQERFYVLQKIQEQTDLVTVPLIVFSKDDQFESLVEARKFNIADYWIKKYDEEGNLILTREQLIDKINSIMNSSLINLQRQLDRRIRKKQIEDQNQWEAQQKKKKKIIVASKDYKLIKTILEELEERNFIPIVVNNPQAIFRRVISEKPAVILLEENISENGVFNICKMLNIKAQATEIILLLEKDSNLANNVKTRELQILKKFSSPFDSGEIVEFLARKFL